MHEGADSGQGQCKTGFTVDSDAGVIAVFSSWHARELPRRSPNGWTSLFTDDFDYSTFEFMLSH